MDDYSGIASPVEANAQDEYSAFASPADASAPMSQRDKDIKAGGQITSMGDGSLGSRINRLGHDIQGAYMGAASNLFAGWADRTLLGDNGPVGDVARNVFGVKGLDRDSLAKQFPGQSDEVLAAKRKEIVNKATMIARQQFAQEQQDSMKVKGRIDPLGFAAGVAGGVDPTYAINPGAGITKNLALKGAAGVAARIGANAGAHAAFGSATDAAYQGADMLDNMQKDFDIERNLTAAATMGVAGAGFQAAGELKPVVSDFVKGLYKTRGVDTTPAAEPMAKTRPITGQGLTPEEKAEYAQVLQTGTHQEIKDWFKGRNVEPPSHSAVHEWVERRDAAAAGHAPEDFADPMFHPEPGPYDPREAVQAHIDETTKNWKNKPDFELVNHVDDIQDPTVRQAAIDEGADHPDALGFLGPDGKVRVFANRIDSPETLNAVLFHESLGHYGLAQQFGDRLDSVIGTLLKRNVGQFGKDVDAWVKRNPGAYNGNRVRAAEEVLANMSNKGELKKSLADALVAHVRSFGRRMGLDLAYNDSEVRQILRMAHNAVVNGNGRDVVANGFRHMTANDNGDVRPVLSPVPDSQPRNETKPEYRSPANDKYAAEDRELDETPYGTTFAEKPESPKFMRRADMDEPLPFTERDVIISRRYRGMLKDNKAQGSGRLAPEYRQHLEDILAKTYGDIPDEISDNIATAWKEGRTPNLAKSVHVYDNRTNQSVGEFPDRSKAFEWIEKQKDAQFYGVSRLGTDAKFIRRSDIEKPEDVADDVYERLNAAYVPKTRSWEDAKAMAEEAGFSPETIKESRSVGNLDRRLFIYDQAAKEANARLVELNKKAEAGELTAEDQADLIKTVAEMNYIRGRIDNDAGQVGRGLNAMKAVQFSRNNLLKLKKMLEEGETNLDALSDPDTALKFLKQYNAMIADGNPKGAAAMLNAVGKPYWWQYLLTWRQNMMLSGLSTHLKSTMDMATMIGRELQEATLAMPGAAVREGLRSFGVKNIEPGVHPTELSARLWGLTRAALEAKTYVDTLNAFKKGNGMPRYANVADPRIPVVSKVSDMIAAQDTFFRSFITNQNLYALGTRKAYQELKLKGGSVNWDDVMTKGAAYAQAPTKAMMDEAHELTENTILLNRSPLNAAVDKSRNIRPGMSGWEQFGSFMSNMLFPFIRVSSNAVLNQIIRRSPLSFLDPVTRHDWAAGGARRDIAVARTMMGTALMGYYWMAADPKKDKLTGEGPDNYNKIKELQAGGWAANAVHENGRYNQPSNLNISLNPLDKHNNIAMMIAGLRGAYEKGAKGDDFATGLKLASIAVMSTLSNQTFIGDLQPFADAVTARGATAEQKVAQFGADEVKTFLPNLTTQAAKIIDPNKHDIKSDTISGTVKNAVLSSIPGQTNKVPIQYNVYGQPMKTGTNITGVHTWITTGNGQNEVTDPTEVELSRLAKLTPAAIVTPTPKTLKLQGGLSLKLTEEQAQEYQKYAGQTLVQAVRDQMANGEWQKMSDQDKVNEVRSIQTQAKSEVKTALLEKEGWLTEKQLSNLRGQLK
jgi:hypothetical protein